MFLLDPTTVPAGLGADTRWLRRTSAGLRLGFWTLWAFWLTQLFGFTAGSVLPLFTPKLKQPALIEVAGYADYLTLLTGLGLVVLGVVLGRPPAAALLEREGRLGCGLRRALVPLWAGWWLGSAVVLVADRMDVAVPALLMIAVQVVFTGASVATLGYLSRMASALGQRAVATVAAILAVYAMIPLELQTIALPLVGEPDWKQWLPVLSVGRLAAWMVVFGGGLMVCGRLRRLLRGVGT